MEPRVSEREVVCALLRNLDLPFQPFSTQPTDVVIRLFVSDDEWTSIEKQVSTMGLDEVTEAWRELPPVIWTDESWVSRVCIRLCAVAKDYRKLILAAS